MSEGIIALMIGVSTLLGALGLFALIWAVKTGQFDDQSKFTSAVHHDNEEDLRDALNMHNKKKAYKSKQEKSKKNYMPPD